MISFLLKDYALVLFICLEIAHDKTTCLGKIIRIGALGVN